MGVGMGNQKTDVSVGTRFGEGGRYEIRERIGRGGMADVYKVADRKMGDKIFAVKLLSVDDDPSLSDSRRREWSSGRAAASIPLRPRSKASAWRRLKKRRCRLSWV